MMTNLYKNWWVHNLIAHPRMQFIQLFDDDLADRFHDSTLPENSLDFIEPVQYNDCIETNKGIEEMKEMIILRGLPGSGKSNFAMDLFELFENSNLTVTYASADTFFMVGNEYKFDPEFLGKAHAHCQNLVVRACVNETQRIIVDNTSTTEKEVKTYLKYAEKYGYKVRSLVVENRHDGVSVHDVPERALERMENRFTLKLR